MSDTKPPDSGEHDACASARENPACGGLLHDSNPRIEMVAVDRLTPCKVNARTHSRRQIEQISESIKRFGFNNPVLVDDDGQILAGHGRVAAAKLLGMAVVPTCRVSHLSPADKRAYIIADNSLAEKAGWDREILATEFKALLDLDFEVELCGFETSEIELILDDAQEAGGDTPRQEDDVPEPVQDLSVSQSGDLWVMGGHRLLCGDACDGASYDRLLEGRKAQFVFTDPPYNVRIAGHASRSIVPHREFAQASGEMSKEEFTAFLKTVFAHLVRHSTDGAIHDVCTDWRHLAEMTVAGDQVYTELKNLCVWTKTHAGMGYFYRNQHELVFVWKSGQGKHISNLDGPGGLIRSNVWEYAGVNTTQGARGEDFGSHPTVKPVALVVDAIKDCSRRNGIVLDPFLGSGTTVMAAERTGRRAHGIEIDPGYVDVAIRRWQRYTGKTATLAGTGQTFEDIEQQRLTPQARLGHMIQRRVAPVQGAV